MEKILKVLNRIEELEGILADLYRRLSGILADNTEIREFFASLSDEETSHRDLARYQIRLIRNSRTPFDDVDADISAIERLSGRVREFAQRPSPTIEEALLAVLDFEMSIAEHYVASSIKQANPEVSELIDNLSRASRKHLLACREIGEKYFTSLPEPSD